MEIDIETPLSYIDWSYMSLVIQEINGMGWFQILPVGQKSSFPLQFNMMHILPSAKIPFAKVPIDVLISNKITYLKKNKKRNGEGNYQFKPIH